MPSVFPTIRVFSSESALRIRQPKYWSFSFSIRPSNEYSRLISFRTDCFDLLVVQGTLKSLLQHHSSKASILRFSAFFMVQLSHPYITTGKTIALTRWIFISKVMSLFFNMLFRFVIAFFPRSKHRLISWLRIYILMADLHFYTAKTWRRKWQPTPVFLTEKFHGQRSLVATGPRSCKVSDTTEHKAQQKSTQHCKVIILQLKVLKNILKRRKHPSALSHPVWQTLWVDVADAV